MKKQFIVQKYVMAESATEAIQKSKKMPVHEVFVHNSWLEKYANYEFFPSKSNRVGFDKKVN